MDLHRFAIDGRVIGADDVQLQDALARVYQSPARPRCQKRIGEQALSYGKEQNPFFKIFIDQKANG